jgi:hypothetical protein
MRLCVLFIFICDVAVCAASQPKDYSADLFPVLRTAVQQVYSGMWGPEIEPPDWFVSQMLDMFHFERVDLNSDGIHEVIAATGGPESNGDIFIFQEGNDGWTVIGSFDGHGGYTVIEDKVHGYNTIRTHQFNTPGFKTLRVVNYTFQRGRYQASKFIDRMRDRSIK